MQPMPSETVVRLWTRLMRARQLALTEIEAALKAGNCPPLVWYDALLELERAGDAGLRPFELEQRMLLPQYGLSRLIDRIEGQGYLARRPCPQDRRGTVVAITGKGIELRRRMWPVYAAAIQAAVGSRLDPDEAAALERLLGRLAAPDRASPAPGSR